ncbi:hypothetical protein BDA96_05G186400 [Sorghum bicolor]|uniref:Major facilitator superfamily (MFS) profile domain-containing protein n=1 Tax=Sorghum bicolor TaxID=4558 RepID=A0A921QY75_SORBI|nr:hypothetical protein BDA96_05G186400 [Sorghum bicolor]
MKSDVRVSNYCKFGSQLLTLFTSSLYIAGLLTAMLLSSWFTARCGRRPSMIIGGAAFLTGGAVNVYMAILSRALLGVGLGFVNQRSIQQRLPAQTLPRLPRREHHQLRRGEDHRRLGLEAVAGPSRRPRRALHAGSPTPWCSRARTVAGRARCCRRSEARTPPPPSTWSWTTPSRRTCGRTGWRRRQQWPAAHPFAAEVPAAAGDRRPDAGVHAAQRDQRHRVLRAGAAAHGGHGREPGAALHGRHGSHLHGVDDRVHVRHRPVRPPYAADRREHLDAGLRGHDRRRHGGQAGGRGRDAPRLRGGAVRPHLRVRGRLQLVVGPMTWLVPTEVFPLEIRSAGQSTTVASGFVFTIFIAQGFPAMLCWMRAWLFFFFAGWIVVMTAFVYLFLPETKGMPIEQIGKVWRDHWFWGRVVGSDELQATHKVSHK